MNDRIVAIAAGQHGTISRTQCAEAGLAEMEISRMVRSGELETVYRRVYHVPSFPRTADSGTMSALLAAGGGDVAAISHHSAALHWRMVLDRPLAEAHVISDRQSRVAGVRCHRLRLFADELTSLRGIRVTTPLRTLLDLAGTSDSRELEQAHAWVERQGRTPRDAVWSMLRRHPYAPGSGLLRRLLLELDTSNSAPLFLRSQAEAEARAMFREAGLPEPLSNQWIVGLEVDFLWPALMLVMEADGLRFHSSPQAVQRDRDRDSILVAAGYQVIRFTWHQLRQQRSRTLATIAAAIGGRQQLIAIGGLLARASNTPRR
jgi:very-short-patch-repair endonuclease